MNQLKVSLQEAIVGLFERGWSQRRIARDLRVDRETVRRYISAAKPAISTTGSTSEATTEPAISTAGSASDTLVDPAISTTGSKAAKEVKPAIPTAGLPAGRVSLCREFLPQIIAALGAGLSAQRIHQDLVSDHGFTGSYESVKRCVRSLSAQMQLPVRRMESAPGEQMQVDFGQGAWVVDEAGKLGLPDLGVRRVPPSVRRQASERPSWVTLQAERRKKLTLLLEKHSTASSSTLRGPDLKLFKWFLRNDPGFLRRLLPRKALPPAAEQKMNARAKNDATCAALVTQFGKEARNALLREPKRVGLWKLVRRLAASHQIKFPRDFALYPKTKAALLVFVESREAHFVRALSALRNGLFTGDRPRNRNELFRMYGFVQNHTRSAEKLAQINEVCRQFASAA